MDNISCPMDTRVQRNKWNYNICDLNKLLFILSECDNSMQIIHKLLFL